MIERFLRRDFDDFGPTTEEVDAVLRQLVKENRLSISWDDEGDEFAFFMTPAQRAAIVLDDQEDDFGF